MSKIGFYIGHGVEVRYFLLSGFTEFVRQQNQVVLLIRENIDSLFFDEYIKEFKVDVIRLPVIKPNKTSIFLAQLIRSFRNSRKRLTKNKIYSHLDSSNDDSGLLDFVKGNLIVHKVLDFIMRPFFEKLNFNQAVEKILLHSKIDHLYLLEYSHPFNKVLGSICSKHKIKVHILLNSLKTIFIDDFISFKIHRLHTWSDTQRKLFIQANPSLETLIFKDSGSPFHTFLRSIDAENVNRVLEKYHLDTSRPIIVYPLIYEQIFSKEHLIIKMIGSFFNSFKKDNRPQLILRRNPFEEKSFVIDAVKSMDNLILFDHCWERDRDQNWSIQSIQGEMEWKALLQISTLLVSYPSMSVLESINCGTPVINIGFDENGFENTDLAHIIHAPFIKQFEKSDYVTQCLTFNDFKNKFYLFNHLKKTMPTNKISSSLNLCQSEINIFYDESND